MARGRGRGGDESLTVVAGGCACIIALVSIILLIASFGCVACASCPPLHRSALPLSLRRTSIVKLPVTVFIVEKAGASVRGGQEGHALQSATAFGSDSGRAAPRAQRDPRLRHSVD